IRKIIAPVAAALRELKNRRAVHGTVNPTTLFAPHTEGGGLQLGECVTTPPGYLQPVAFEPLGRAMASPAGRGTVAIGDDLYALGVTAMFMLFGRMPGGSLDDARLIETKIELGSYAALVGGNQLPQAITEPLRGLLLDDPAHRWSLDDLEQWLTGRRQTPRRAEIAGRTARRIPFAGKDYKNLRLLAMAMAKDTAAADEVIQDGTLEDWLGRNSGDDGIAHRVEEAKRSASVGKGGVLAERRVSRVLMVLDPQAPVRYRGLAVTAEGIGGALAEAFATGRATQELAEIIAAQLPMAWVNAQQAADPRFAAMAGQFDLLSGFVGETSLGYGAERCLYELSPSMPCAGPLLRGRVILDASDLLRALEDIAGGAERPKEPMDRHIAAFLMAHQARLIRGPMSLLAEASTLHERCIATIAVFEIVQRRLDLPPLPQLCRWLAELAGPAIAAYHSRSLRDGLGGQLGRVWKTGLLQALGGVVNNHALAGRDRDGFLNAQAAHRQAGRIIALRRGELRRRRELSVVAGRQAASIIASLLSVVAVSGAIVMAVL
ncbi:MAG: serine/threonine protein kinase, partial [Inquilinus sp.]|nr:serine/threonine protein kinase [Inquilinus sp.]